MKKALQFLGHVIYIITHYSQLMFDKHIVGINPQTHYWNTANPGLDKCIGETIALGRGSVHKYCSIIEIGQRILKCLFPRPHKIFTFISEKFLKVLLVAVPAHHDKLEITQNQFFRQCNEKLRPFGLSKICTPENTFFLKTFLLSDFML